MLSRSAFVALVATLITCVPNLHAFAGKERYTQQQAQKLATSAVKEHDPSPVWAPYFSSYNPDFYYFEEINSNPNTGAHIATVAVNMQTGDVWDIAGSVCTHLLPKTAKNLEAMKRPSECISEYAVPWIRLVTIGPQDKPMPLIWFSKEKLEKKNLDLDPFEEEWATFLVLESPTYDQIAGLTRSLSCVENPNPPVPWGTYQITENIDSTHRTSCVVFPHELCVYLEGVSTILNESDNASYVGRNFEFRRRIPCES